ncbi:MAG: N-acetylneuraminate synthase [Bacteroidota bacterium]
MLVRIGNTQIGPEHPCYIIAEAGVNHNGQLDLALELVRQAKAIGVDCVKFQTFKAEAVVTLEAPKANYQLKVTDQQESQFEMLKKLELQLEDYHQIIALCKELDIQFLSTPYNFDDADFLNQLGVAAFKIASGQLVELAFLDYVARFQKPMIISSGMATLAEVYEGVQTIRQAGNHQIVLLQCTTNYPSAIEDANIRAMVSMQQSLNIIVGYSDHVANNYACYAAVSLGAKLIEKHFTLDKNMEGPDHSSSLNPTEFKALVDGIRLTEKALGSSVKTPTAAEVANTQGMRRSIVLLENLSQGSTLQMHHLAFKRPATGLAPKRLPDILGKQINQDLNKDSILKEEHINW